MEYDPIKKRNNIVPTFTFCKAGPAPKNVFLNVAKTEKKKNEENRSDIGSESRS